MNIEASPIAGMTYPAQPASPTHEGAPISTASRLYRPIRPYRPMTVICMPSVGFNLRAGFIGDVSRARATPSPSCPL